MPSGFRKAYVASQHQLVGRWKALCLGACLYFIEEKLTLTHVEVKKDFIQCCCDRCVQQVTEIGLNSESSQDKWEFIAKDKVRGSVEGKLLRENIKSKGILLKQTEQDSH